MRLKIGLTGLGLLLNVTARGASAPPPYPNFCANGICLEISQLSGKDVEVETRTKGEMSEILIRYPRGTAKLVYSSEKSNTCPANPGHINVRKIGQKFVGSGCLSLPNDEIQGRRVSLEYVPVQSTGTSLEEAKLNFPVLHIWSVDIAPVSFWKSGYSLRVGEGLTFKWLDVDPHRD